MFLVLLHEMGDVKMSYKTRGKNSFSIFRVLDQTKAWCKYVHLCVCIMLHLENTCACFVSRSLLLKGKKQNKTQQCVLYYRVQRMESKPSRIPRRISVQAPSSTLGSRTLTGNSLAGAYSARDSSRRLDSGYQVMCFDSLCEV